MNIAVLKRVSMLGLAAVALVGCSSASDTEVTDASILRGLFSGKGKQEAPDAQQIAVQVQTAMAATDAPMMLVAVPNRKAVAVMQQIETNGPYATFGARERVSMTLRGGMVTATRGFGDDLMSSNVNAALDLVSRRKAGPVTRVQRFLDGENQTVELVTNCVVAVGGTSSLEIDGKPRMAQALTETCQAQVTQFQNSYQVDTGTGQILQSRQWIGPLNGHLVMQVLQ